MRWFITLIPNGHKFVCNPYVHGRISAVLKLICCPSDGHVPMSMGNLKRYSNPNEDYGFFFEVYTSEERYRNAKKIIEAWYPGVCEFDITPEEDYCAFAEDEHDGGACCLGSVVND